MPLNEPKEILAYFAQAKSQRAHFESRWQAISEYIRGDPEWFNARPTPGLESSAHMYDNTGQVSSANLISAMHNFLTNTSTGWFLLAPEDDRLLEEDGVPFWFEVATRRVRASFDAPESAFVPSMHEFYADLVDYGTGSPGVEDVGGPTPVRFHTAPLAQVYGLESHRGSVDTVFLCFRLTNRQAVDRYGEAAARAWERVEQKPNDELEYVQLLHRSSDPAHARRPLGGQFPWRSVTVCLEGPTKVEERGFEELPQFVARWERRPGEVYGRSPGWRALPSCQMVARMKRDVLTGAQLRVRPPLIAPDDGVVFPVKLRPGGVTKVRASAFLGRTEPIQTLDVGGDIGIGVDLIRLEQEQIQAAFMHEVLEILRQNFQTARQVIEIVERAQALLSPVIGRLQVEVLEPMLARVYGINARAGRLPEAPPALQNAPIKITYVSPVQRAQRMGELRALVDALGIIGELQAIDPTVSDHVDFDQVPKEIFEATGATQKLLRSAREVQAVREARAQVLAEQRQQEGVERAARAAGQMAPALQAIEGGKSA